MKVHRFVKRSFYITFLIGLKSGNKILLLGKSTLKLIPYNFDFQVLKILSQHLKRKFPFIIYEENVYGLK